MYQKKDRQRQRQTKRKTDRQTGKEKDKDRQRWRLTDRQDKVRDWQTVRDWKTDKVRHWQTVRKENMYLQVASPELKFLNASNAKLFSQVLKGCNTGNG